MNAGHPCLRPTTDTAIKAQSRPSRQWRQYYTLCSPYPSQHADEPFITIGALASVFYFAWYLVLVPVVGVVENTLADLDE
jgi:hypothetical protein